MKNSIKIALVLLCIGAILIVVGLSLGARTFFRLSDGDIGYRFGDTMGGIGDFVGNVVFAIADNADRYNAPFEKVDVLGTEEIEIDSEYKKLAFDLNGYKLTVKPSGDDKYYLEYEVTKNNEGKKIDSVPNVYDPAENKHMRFELDTGFKTNLNKKRLINAILYVPITMEKLMIEGDYGAVEIIDLPMEQFMSRMDIGDLDFKGVDIQKMEVNLDVGSLHFEDSKIDDGEYDVAVGDIYSNNSEIENSKLKIGVGSARLSDSTLKDVRLDVTIGDIEVGGKIEGEVELIVEMGNVDVELENGKKDVYINANTGLGNIEVGGIEVGRNYKNGDKNGAILNIRVSTGEVEIER